MYIYIYIQYSYACSNLAVYEFKPNCWDLDRVFGRDAVMNALVNIQQLLAVLAAMLIMLGGTTHGSRKSNSIKFVEIECHCLSKIQY